jgi:hypothetical protein
MKNVKNAQRGITLTKMKISKKEKNEFLTHVPRSAVPKY